MDRANADSASHCYQREWLKYPVFAVTELIGVAAVVFVVVWVTKYQEGFAWDGSYSQFNWHPVLMIIGLLFLFGNSIVIFRVLSSVNKFAVKLVHASLHTTSIVCIILALYAVINNKNFNNQPHFFSLHSWVGITTVALFATQFFVGFAAYLFPQFPQDKKEWLMPVHKYLGATIFIMAIVSIVSGIQEQFSFIDTPPKNPYASLPAYGAVGNLVGASAVLFGLGVGLLLTNSAFAKIEKVPYVRFREDDYESEDQ